jgi:hypothetical protein
MIEIIETNELGCWISTPGISGYVRIIPLISLEKLGKEVSLMVSDPNSTKALNIIEEEKQKRPSGKNR